MCNENRIQDSGGGNAACVPLVFAGDAVLRDPAVTINFFEDDQEVTHDWGWANGQLWSARSSKNDVEYIGCSYKAIERDDGMGGIYVYKWGFCQAQDVDEVHVVCFTENPELLDAMQATTPFCMGPICVHRA